MLRGIVTINVQLLLSRKHWGTSFSKQIKQKRYGEGFKIPVFSSAFMSGSFPHIGRLTIIAD
jgi:hypothetical protein